MKIAVYGRSGSEQNVSALKKLCRFVLNDELEVIVSKQFWQEIEKNNHSIICNYELFTDFDRVKNEVDVVFSIGGDGTLLNTVDLVAGTTIPVIGINTGRLGFLAHFLVEDIETIIQNIQANYYHNDFRNLLEISATNNLFSAPQLALNEFTIQKQDPSAVIKVHTYLDDKFLSSYYADGIILSTPTGSTGYNLSADGPLIMPKSNTFAITPIAPHNLNQRPIVIPDTSVVKFSLSEHRGKSYCTADSKYWEIDENFEFTVKKSNFTMNILKQPNSGFVETLRTKLLWGADNRNT